MNHIPSFKDYNTSNQLVNETYAILEGSVSHEDLEDVLSEGIFSFIKGMFSNPKKKRELDKLGEELFKIKVELQKLEIEQNDIDKFTADLKSGSDEYTAAQSKLKVADKAKAAKINALRKKEEIIIAKMDTIGEESDKLTKYVNKVKLEIRMRANDATIKLADDEMARVLQQLQKKDAKEVKNLDKELIKAA
tara:strand:+ start:2712 stop:3287 length:576 start_codon:yes stop_codon:yes gene_type:complete